MTRQDQSQAVVEWMQAALGGDEDLLAEIVRAGIQALMKAERDVHVGAERFERTAVLQAANAGDAGATCRR